MSEFQKMLQVARFQPTTVGNMALDGNGGYCAYQAVEQLRAELATLKRQRVDFADEIASLAGMIPSQEMAHAASALHKKLRIAIADSN